jgi:hypothetical protein
VTADRPARPIAAARYRGINIPAVQSRDELLVAFGMHIERPGTRRFFVTHSVQTSFAPIDSGRIAIGILITVIAVVPIEYIQATVRPGLLHDRHEPGIIGREEIVLGVPGIRCAIAGERIAINAIAVNVPHVQLAAILGRIGVAVEIMNTAIGGLLMMMADDRFDFPSKRRIRTRLAMVVAALDQVPQVVDHARTDKRAAGAVPGDAPRITRSLGE